MRQAEGSATREIRYESLGDRDPGDIWGTRDLGVFVVVSSCPARWRGEDIDVYAHIDTWYTIRPATEAETALWTAAVTAATARRGLRARLGAVPSHRYDPATRRLVSDQRALDSYDDRWTPPANIVLDADAVAVEDQYLAAVARLKAH